MDAGLAVLSALAAYLLGSIPSAYVLLRLTKGMDIRTAGTGNVGALNAQGQLGTRLTTLAGRTRTSKAAGKTGADLLLVVTAGKELESAISEARQLLDLPFHESRERMVRWREERVFGAPQYAVISMLLLPSLDRMAAAPARTEASLNGATIAAALGDYRLRTGAYPVFLEDLQVELPVDPFTGKPYHYRREGSGFVVYSVGDDGDNGGDEDLDLVFRSPQ